MISNPVTDIALDFCPLCNGQNQSELFPAAAPFLDFGIVQCHECGLAHTFPLPANEIVTTDTSTYYGNSENKFIPILQKIRNALMNNRARYFLSLLKRNKTVPKILDVGCAEGRLLNAFYKTGCQCWGVEHGDYPKCRFMSSENITYIQGELESISLADGSFDLIIFWHVLEHMNNPDVVFRKAARLLAENGVMILAVPNFSSIEAKIFKCAWFHLDVPWHKYHFTKKSLEYLIKKNNLWIVKSSTFCLEQGVYGVVQSILNAMGWPRNELYEALKGSFSIRRIFPLLAQWFLSILLLMPCLAFLFISSALKKGPVIKLVLKKRIKV
jgi:2-polyprenyl-3-methyl-5-hydroxy-6-metoxy-1,4-benzoquinol methylase